MIKESEDRFWLSQAGGLDQDMVKIILAGNNMFQHFPEIFSHSATHAAVVELEDSGRWCRNNASVDAYIAKFIFNDCDSEGCLCL